MSTPKYFRADEDEELGEKTSPAPTEWFGTGRKKYNTKTPTFSKEDDEDFVTSRRGDYSNAFPRAGADGWREFFQGLPREPLWNPLLPPGTKEEAIKFRDAESDSRALVYVLEQAAEIFESGGHTDLAAECEMICELACMED